MKILDSPLSGVKVIEPNIFEDARGYFFEVYNTQIFQNLGLHFDFVQDNQSKSNYGVVRGLHYQLAPKAQTKLVRVLAGVIFDVAVDLRKNSPTYGQWFGVELSAENKKQLLVPKGFAHGFSVLSETAEVLYKCDELYSSAHDRGIRFDDADLAIDWHLPKDKIQLSEKDTKNAWFKDAEMNF
jgi:dTDP-4-dehydrorhamnose 3,5-epimerase